MKIAIMQPYFCPYIGYFQLISSVDAFVIYDNIQYTKKGWINRNRILINGKDEYISLPLKKDSDYRDIYQRSLALGIQEEKQKILRKIRASYLKAPQFETVFPLLAGILENPEDNLFEFIRQSLVRINAFLGLKTPLIVSSTLPVNHTLRSQEKVLAICKSLGATSYINPIGGLELYEKEVFAAEGISLRFLNSGEIRYPQFNNDFIPWLSIIDVLMFNDSKTVTTFLQTGYSLL